MVESNATRENEGATVFSSVRRFAVTPGGQSFHSGHVAAWTFEALRKAAADHAGTCGDDHGHPRVRPADLECTGQSGGHDELEVALRQLRSRLRDISSGRDAQVEKEIPAVDVAERAQGVPESIDQRRWTTDNEADAPDTSRLR